MNNSGAFDLGPLTWVKGEIDQALNRAGAALQGYAAAQAADPAMADAAPLQAARNHVHQANGALSIVGLDGVTQFTAAIEQVLLALAAAELPWSGQVADVCQRALAMVSGYLDELLAGAPDRALRLLPLYRELAALRGATPAPADLFYPDLAVCPPRREKEPAALAPAALTARLKAARLGFQRGMLKWLKGEARGLTEMRNSLAVIELTQAPPAARAFWWVALAFLDALIVDGLAVDASVKRLCARIDAQIARLLEAEADQEARRDKGEADAAGKKLLREMLYCVAIASTAGATTDHIACVRAAYRLAELIPEADTEADAAAANLASAVSQRALRDTLETAKEEWNRYASQHPAALAPFQAAARRLAEQGRDLGQVDLARLVASIGAVADMLASRSTQEVDAGLALEVATALLLADSALENLGRLGVDFAHQVDVMAGRLTVLLRGETPAALQALEVPQLDEIARRAQERLLRDQVVREMLGNLVAVEQKLDGFFRDPAARAADLPALAGPLKQIEGALTMLGEMRAVDVLRECRQKVAEFAEFAESAESTESGQPGRQFAQADFEDVASKLSALGFFVEKLRHGPADLDAILQPQSQPPSRPASAQPEPAQAGAGIEAATISATADQAGPAVPEASEAPGEDRLLMPVLEHLPDADAEVPTLMAEQIEQLEQLEHLEHLEQPAADLPSLIPPVAAPSAEAMRLADASSETIDAELLGIFLEEAREVLDTIATQLPQLAAQPHDLETLAVMRRAFHTLKGSGRMVGLTDLGEAAWSVEQVLNQWLKLEQGASPGLQGMLEAAHASFRDWTACLEAGAPTPTAESPAVVELHAACRQLMAGDELARVDEDADTGMAAAPEPVPEPVSEAAAVPAPQPAHAEDLVVIGELSLSPAVYEIYLAEARSHLAVLIAEQASLAQAPPTREILRASHTLGGVSGTVGVRAVNRLGKALEYALERFADAAAVPDAQQQALLSRCIASLQDMVDDLASRRLPEDAAALLAELEELKPESQPLAEPRMPTALVDQSEMLPQAEDVDVVGDVEVDADADTDSPFVDQRRKLRIHDDLDPQLLPIFIEEGNDLLREIGGELRVWRTTPDDPAIGPHLQRLLHTLKGSARMAGAMRMGELVHGIETRLIQATRHGTPPVPAFLDDLETCFDRALGMFDGLIRIERGDAAAGEGAAGETPATAAETPAPAAVADGAEAMAEVAETTSQRTQLRVRAELVDEFINAAGEMAIARGRIEGEMRSLKGSLLELTENVIRLRQQLREIEIQAESRMQSQLNLQQESQQAFDPLEMDRFTRFQELTRMMAESVNDVTTVQHNLLRNVDNASAAITAQARLNRDLSQALMGVRMLPFNAIVDRLYRVVRQVAKELGRRVNLDIRGGQIELDRSVLEKMQGPIEHLLRNAVVHGIEDRQTRRAAGKPEIGEIVMTLAQQGNEIVIELADDGAGLDYARIRSKALELGMLGADEPVDEQRLAQFIFSAGFSTAQQVSEVAGRGVGMDVVRTEAMALGGRIEVHSASGQGTRFRISLPLTLAVSQALLVRSGNRSYALPSTMVEQVMELRPEAAMEIRAAGGTDWLDTHYPWYSLAQLLGEEGAKGETAAPRRHWILLLKGADRHIALEVDGVGGNQEIVVKNIGPQLARVPGIAGATVLNDGEIALILNPLVLAGRERVPAAEADATGLAVASANLVAAPPASVAPTIMVVDDSLTVRKIVGRLLAREGYQVVTAKDGVDALEQLADFVPTAMLVDIEMPRMDGFELTRHVRADARLRAVPIVMITSRIADKHREHALALGVNAYLGKPYDDEALLGLLRDYAAQQQVAATAT
ncbi:hypothetical protein ACY05_03245 [Sterolibacterium denitrificans]|uniref:Chemotaxis protein CheA n=1 Tax=Sterolibacterium denitrificans TaxID=157592 RepID=A0A656Z8U8_9PROT|nr:Hpt domain-containing protein [Sterolibacterium denitrificans]KYC28895.1 hypothetical protein ACY05_03245 [Sterolibacterium denitrificans]